MAGTSIEKAGPGHAEVEHVSHPHPVYNPDAPSEAWGWHGSFRDFAPKGSRLILWIFAIMMFVMIIGNHDSRVENWWLLGIGVLMIAWLVRDDAARRKARRRKV